MVINKKEIIRRVAKKTGYRQDDVADVVDAMIDTVKSAVLDGDEVTLWGFLSVGTQIIPEHEGQDFKTNKRIIIPAHPKIKVTVSDSWNDRLS